MSSGHKQHTSGIFLKLQGEEGKKNIFESPDAEYPASTGLRLACAQSGPGLWAHFLPRAYTVIAFLAFFFFSCDATGAYSLGLLTSYNGLPMPEDGLGRGRAEETESKQGRCRRVQLRLEGLLWASGASALLD